MHQLKELTALLNAIARCLFALASTFYALLPLLNWIAQWLK